MWEPGPPPSAPGFSPKGHLLAAAVLFGLSALGVALPALLRRSARKTGPRRTAALDGAVRLGTCFGFGTILSTAVIHMLPSAVSRLDDSALLPGSNGHANSPRAYQLLLLSLLAMHFLDWGVSALSPVIAARQTGSRNAAAAVHLLHHSHNSSDMLAPFARVGEAPDRDALHTPLLQDEERLDPGHPGSARCENRQSDPGRFTPARSDELGVDLECMPQRQHGSIAGQHRWHHANGSGSREVSTHVSSRESPDSPAQTSVISDSGATTAQARERSLVASVVGLALLELGVSVHSTLIGLGLGVARGETFHTLLLALCIHQFFEGLALGGVAEDVSLGRGLCVTLGGIFAASTPLGVVAGVLLRSAAGGSGAQAVALEGSMEAVGAGILLYVGLVQLLAPHMSRARWLRAAGPGMKAAAFVALWAGATAMTLLGRWI